MAVSLRPDPLGTAESTQDRGVLALVLAAGPYHCSSRSEMMPMGFCTRHHQQRKAPSSQQRVTRHPNTNNKTAQPKRRHRAAQR